MIAVAWNQSWKELVNWRLVVRESYQHGDTDLERVVNRPDGGH